MSQAGETIPYFHAMAVFACKGNRFYRIYVRPEELVFIWAGSGGEGLAGAAHASRSVSPASGLVGAVLAAVLAPAMKAVLDPAKKNAARREVLDSTPLEQLIGDNPKNLRAPIDGFTEVRIRKRSDRHARMTSDHRHQAILFLRHQSLGKYVLGIASAADVRVAMTELPRVLDDVYKAEIELPEQDQPCGCPFCR
jgi:hypothetical protein